MNGDKFLKIGVGIVVVFLLGIVFKLAKSVLVPFCLALLLSFAISPLLRLASRRKVPKLAALAIVLLVTFISLYLLGVLLYSSGKSFANELPSYNDMLKNFLEGIESTFPSERLRVGFEDWVKQFDVDKVGSFLVAAIGSFFSFMSGLLLVFIFLVFILAGRGRMADKIVRAFSPKHAAAMAKTIQMIDHEIQKYLAVKTLVNLAIGILSGAVLALFGLPFAVIFGFFAFVANYIPTLGAFFAVTPPVLMSLLYFDKYGPAFWILVILTALHVGLSGQVEPRLMGKDLSLSPLLVLFSLFFGWWLWGIPGMFLVVPLLAVLKIVFGNIPSLAFLEAMMDK